MYSEIYGEGFDRIAQSPELIELHDWYRGLCADGRLPPATAIDLSGLRRIKPHLMLLEQVSETDYRYDHYGSGIAAAAGFDMTGKTTADFGGALAEFFRSSYARSRLEGRPLMTVHRAVKATRVHLWERLLLPFSNADGRTTFLVYNRPRAFREDFLNAVLDIVPDGVLALQALRDESGQVMDAAVLSANPAALRMLGIASDGIEGEGFRSYASRIGIGDIWAPLSDVIATRAKADVQMLLPGAEPRHLRVRIEPLGDGALLLASDVTDLVSANQILALQQEALRRELDRRQGEAEQLRTAAATDPLTDLYNRRGFFERAAALKAGGGPVSVVALDIDWFKAINDRYGHAAGDDVLRAVAIAFAETAGAAGGISARFGGEEFVALVPAPPSRVRNCVEGLRARIAATPVASALGPIMLTCSFGISDAQRAPSVDAALQEADAALYEAKRTGRNRVVVAGARATSAAALSA